MIVLCKAAEEYKLKDRPKQFNTTDLNALFIRWNNGTLTIGPVNSHVFGCFANLKGNYADLD